MTTTSLPSESEFDRRAQELFFAFCEQVERGEKPDFEAFCAAHREHERDLRAMHSLHAFADTLGKHAVDDGWESELLRRLRGTGARDTRYRVLGKLAEGGMGAILRIWDDELRRTLAMKVILGKGEPESGETPDVDPKTLGRFLEEAQITGQLDHPGIVPVHELGLDASGRVYFTMKLVKGEDLKAVFEHVHAGHKDWNQVRALNVMLRVCEAIAYAHSKNVVHRDLKPANVMVGKFGEVYVMDWGLARVLGREDKHDLRIRPESAASASVVRTERREQRASTPDSPLVTMDGDVVGTPSYMPPEQARGQLDKLGPHSDVYSIGAMLYQLVTGRVPYVPPEGRVTNRTILNAVLHRAPEPLEALAPRTPPELAAIIEKAMEREIAARYPTTMALADDLRAYLDGRVVAAYEAGTWAETRKWVQRNKPLAASLAAAAVALVGGIAFSVNFARETEAANVALSQKTNELEQLNSQIERQRSEVERKNAELRAASREDKLRGRIQDLARLRAESRTLDGLDRLGKPAYLWWISESEKLLNGQAEARGIEWRPGLKDVQAKLAELRSGSSLLPYTDEDAARDFASHPDRALLASAEAEPARLESRLRGDIARLERQVNSHALRLGEQPWPAESAVAARYAEELEATHWLRPNRDAWKLVGPPATPQSAEDSVRAMLLARRAVDVAPDMPAKAVALNTYAWSLARLGRFEEALAQSAQAVAGVPRIDAKRDPMWTEVLLGTAQLSTDVAKWTGPERAARETELAEWRVELEQRRASLDGEIAAQTSQLAPKLAELRTRCGERRTWRFPDSAVEWNHTLLSTLEADLRWQEQMLSIAKEAAFSDRATARWAEAIDGIAKAPKYAGQKWPSGERLTPQLGLLPLGENPATGLWEFVHLQTGTEPALAPDGRVLRDAEGRLTLSPETGMVFVLLPGGHVPKSTVGDGQKEWITQVGLDPFFLSKYELTHEQWDRVSLRRGFHDQGNTPLVPANNISWDDIASMLQREVGWCGFPSEAQWEYGCRAKSTTSWWTGNDEKGLIEAANIWHRGGNVTNIMSAGALRANAFGLHDVYGNVWEWCGDMWLSDSNPRPGDGLRDDGVAGSAYRVFRGGSWSYSASYGRSQDRLGFTPERRNIDLGVRPARAITP